MNDIISDMLTRMRNALAMKYDKRNRDNINK